jgi:hypothetical protein
MAFVYVSPADMLQGRRSTVVGSFRGNGDGTCVRELRRARARGG